MLHLVKEAIRILVFGPNRFGLFWFIRDFRQLRKQLSSEAKSVPIRIYPCLQDNTKTTYYEPTYTFQDAWTAGHIFRIKPTSHFDVGSSLKFNSIIAQFTRTTMIDIRPPIFPVPKLEFKAGSILELPLESSSIISISSLCVLEHIGLGRYGDPIDAHGTVKAALELQRVLRRGGNLYVSLPIDSEDKVYFNAHRAFKRDSVIKLFPDCQLRAEAYQYQYELVKDYRKDRGFGTGLFWFSKDGIL